MTETSANAQSFYHSTRTALLQAALPHAAFDGWADGLLDLAIEDNGTDAHEAHLAFPRGELDLVIFWSEELDSQARAVLEAADLPAMKIRERVTTGVWARLDAMDGQEEAALQARTRLLRPDAGHEASRLLWATADMIWQAIGDPSTDFNYYSKRTILSGVYASTLSIWLHDTDPDKTKTRDFLDRRIENVMQFEKTKRQVQKITDNLPGLGPILGRMRYGFGPRF
ncbi:COQ9 family protein [Maricaulis sp.]|uniref:COQ9 family protein n=1 Tax=Maricaulis sp. TaxID=1486257 RepID=UPI00262F6CFC|nr:COQ9 family protein [Maricaulis sp.]